VLAAILGILLGLIITKLTESRNVTLELKRESMVAQLQQAGKDLTDGARKLTLMPSLEQRMTVLLMGVDSNGRGTKRWLNTRSDTMILVSMDPEHKKVGMVSIPRDSRVAIAGHGVDKINSAHALGGPELAVATVHEAFGVPIDHYVVIDAQGLKKVFEALGPIDVLVEKKMHYHDWAGHLHVELEPGWHQLTPEQAEEYVRFRHDARGDIGRIERQQWFLRQVANKFKEPQVLLKLPELFKIASDYVVTDLSPEDMAKIANFGKDIQSSQVTSGTVPGKPSMINGGSYWEPDYTGASIVLNRIIGTPMSSSVTDTLADSTSNSAFAATSGLASAGKVSVTLRYPRGMDQVADAYTTALMDAGYRVRYKIRADASDCQHEQIVQSSMKADDLLTEKLQGKVPQLAAFPVVVNVDEHSSSDFTIVLAPNTVAPPVAAKTPEELAAKPKEQQPIVIEAASEPVLREGHRGGKRRRSRHTKAQPEAAQASDESSESGDMMEPTGSATPEPNPQPLPTPTATPSPTQTPATPEPVASPVPQSDPANN